MYAQDDHDLECHGERQYNLGAELCEINENKGCGITVACQYLLYGYVLMRSGRTTYAQKQFGIATTLEPRGGRPPNLAWHSSLAQGRFAEAKEISNWQQGIDIIENNLDIAFNERDPEELKAAIQAMPKTNLASIGLYATVLAEFDSP